MTFKCLLVINEACLMELFILMSTTDTYYVIQKCELKHLMPEQNSHVQLGQGWPTELASLHRVAVPINVHTLCCSLAC